jgi:3-oxoacyl-[acyl-carrier-protein] synthase II
MADKRVLITGVGPVSAVGIGREAFTEGLRRGQSGVGPITAFPTDRLAVKQAAEVRGFDVRDYLETEKPYLDRASQFAFAAMSLALEDANLDLKRMDRSSIGLLLGSALGCLGSVQLFFNDFIEKGPRFVKPIIFPHTYANTTISLLAIEYGLEGYHLAFASGATSAAGALAQGYDLIRTGRLRMALAGGVDALSPMRLRWTAPSPARSDAAQGSADGEAAVPPPGEGAGILVLEEAEQARQRGANVYGEILGVGLTGGDIAKAMRLACGNLNVRTISAAGTSPNVVVAAVSAASLGARTGETPVTTQREWAFDEAEARAICDFRGTRAAEVSIVRLKPLLGETLGADAALRAIAALCGAQPGATLVNSIDPGGNVVCLALGRPI